MIHAVTRKEIRSKMQASLQLGQVEALVASEINSILAKALNEAIAKERDEFLGRADYERSQNPVYRNGFKNVTIPGFLGSLTLRKPDLRSGSFVSSILTALKVASHSMAYLLASRFWLRGTATRAVAQELNHALGTKISASDVSTLTNALAPTLDAWEKQPLPQNISYIFLDACYLKSRKERFTCKQALLVAIGVDDQKRRHFLGFLLGDTESKESWTMLLQNLLARGLNRSVLRLIISDQHQAILAAVADTLALPHQLCLVHKLRNLLAILPRQDKKTFRDAFKEIFWLSDSKSSALIALNKFKIKWIHRYPRAVRLVDDNFQMFTAFFDEPAEFWLILRSSNLVERFIREIKRRFYPAGAMQNDLEVSKLLWSVVQAQQSRWNKLKIYTSKSIKEAVLAA